MICGDDVALRAGLGMKLSDLRQSLGENEVGENDDDSVCRLLVDHVVMLWLEVELTRMAAHQPMQFNGDGRFWEERYDRAHRRYLAAIRELAAVRQLTGRYRETTS